MWISEKIAVNLPQKDKKEVIMYRKLKLYGRRTVLCLLFVVLGLNGFAGPFKLGSAKVILTMEADDSSAFEGIRPIIISSSLLGAPYNTEETPMKRIESGVWTAEIETEQPSSIVSLIIYSSDSCLAMNLIRIEQNDSTVVSAKRLHDGVWNFSVNSDDPINKTWGYSFISTPENLATSLSRREVTLSSISCDLSTRFNKADFNDHRIVGRTFQEMFEELTDFSTENTWQKCVEPWFYNNLRYGFAAAYELSYRKKANEWFGIPRDSVPIYPDEYYNFLKDIDLSDEAFFTHMPVSFTPFYFSYQLLSRFEDIPSIGDMAPTDWKAIATERLTSLGMNLTPNFIDFLLATAYLRKIREGTTLTPAQIQNVSTAFSDDLDKIILQKNDELVEVQKQVEIFDANINKNR